MTSAIGVGAPGRVDAKTGDILSGGYVNLAREPLSARLRSVTGRPLAVDNDATMALVAEARVGAGRGARDIVLVAIGTGIGAALNDSRIVYGAACAGQFGHITVNYQGAPCACGRRGCFEAEAAGPASARLVREGRFDAATTVEAPLADDRPPARTVVERWAAALRAGVDSLIAAFDPERVILGGGRGAGGAGPRAMKRVILVNGVPASGKSTLARALAAKTGWPVLALDTVKEALFAHLGAGDREHNRLLGRASYQAIFAAIGDFPDGATAIVDAWFGFQPRDVVVGHLRRPSVERVVEIWLRAQSEVVGARYAERAGRRGDGHPGLAYVSELEQLARRAKPLRGFSLIEVDAASAYDADALAVEARRLLGASRAAAAPSAKS
jgi:glucokinase